MKFRLLKVFICRIIPVLGIAVAAVFLTNCANEAAPIGGKKDVTPPKLKNALPKDQSVFFTANEIKLSFNEFIQNSGFINVLISPPLDKKPTFTIKKKTLLVKLKSELKPNTTYTINFGDDIKDNNEGNVLSNFTYVFSTGSYIDSMKLSGKITNAKDNLAAEGAIVSLYPVVENDTSDISNTKPFYFAKTDKSGNYTIKNVKAGAYNLYTLKDQNLNYLYDQPNELIGFKTEKVVLSDSSKVNGDMVLFEEQPKKLSLVTTLNPEVGLLKFIYSKPIKTFKLESELYAPTDIAVVNPTKDTVSYWYSRYYEKKAKIYTIANDSLRDTTTIELKSISKDSIVLIKNALSLRNQEVRDMKTLGQSSEIHFQDLYTPLKTSLSRPSTGINNSDSLQILEDSTKKTIPVKYQLDSINKMDLSLNFEKKENTSYTLTIPDSTFRDLFGTYNSKILYHFKTQSKDKYGNIKLVITIANPEKFYILQLMNKNNDVVATGYIGQQSAVKYQWDNIPADDYHLQVIEDDNGNGVWDTGNFKERRLPEKKLSFPQSKQLKGGWDLELELKL